jgi:hypothetical protein
MRKLIIAVLLLSANAFGAVAFKQAQHCDQVTNTALSCTAAIAVDAGDAVVVMQNASGNGLSYVISNDCGLTFNIPPGYAQNISNSAWVNIQVAVNAPQTSASCNITLTRGAGSNDNFNQWVAATYSGVSSVGGSWNQYGGSITVPGACPVTPITTGVKPSAVGNWLVSAHRSNTIPGTGTAGNFSFAAVSPSVLRTQGRSTAAIMALLDKPVATAGAVTYNTSTLNGTSGVVLACSRGEVELVASTAQVQSARLSDSARTVLLSGSTNQYQLPGIMLAPNFCTFVMPTGSAGNYQIATQGPNTLNGQSNPIPMPIWQMSRVCQDANGAYWANPPLIAGSGISISNTPTAITISTSSTLSAPLNREHGTAIIEPHRLAAGVCSRPIAKVAPRIHPSDVIEVTLRSEPDPFVSVYAFPGVKHVDFEVCNGSAHSVLTHRVTLNWEVAR